MWLVCAVWCDNRTAGVAQELIGATPTKDKDCLKVCSA